MDIQKLIDEQYEARQRAVDVDMDMIPDWFWSFVESIPRNQKIINAFADMIKYNMPINDAEDIIRHQAEHFVRGVFEDEHANDK